MDELSFSPNQTKKHAIQSLRDALTNFTPTVDLDKNGYTADFRDNLLPGVLVEDFEQDLRQGDGNELEGKFRAAHSSSALGVNCFAPFRRHLSDLSLLGKQGFEILHFERKCPTGLRGRRAPNLDLLVQTENEIIGVESKLTEYLTRHRAKFSPAYVEQIQDHRCNQRWFKEMLRLMEKPDAYHWLDAAQLIKHAFGLEHTFPDKQITLLYLYWEPLKTEGHSVFAEHRREISDFANQVSGSGPQFRAMSYPELWKSWTRSTPEWLSDHISNLLARYSTPLKSR